MSMSTGLSEQARERLSRLVDGEAAPDELQQLLAGGRESPQTWSDTLEAWHAYHLVGDVMRSDELTGQGHDSAFLARLRERLADEPVVMAPAVPQVDEAMPREPQAMPVAVREGRRLRRWRAPLAAAASVMVVAGVAVLTGLPGRQDGIRPGGTTLVQAPASLAPPPRTALALAPAATEPRLLTANGPLLRDARLDQYLSAHKQFGGSSALGVPSGFLRSATYEGPSH